MLKIKQHSTILFEENVWNHIVYLKIMSSFDAIKDRESENIKKNIIIKNNDERYSCYTCVFF